MLSAAYTGDIDTVTQMLDDGPKLITAQFAYYGPLHYALRGGSLPMVQLLLGRGAHPKAPGWNYLGDETPIKKALDRNRADIAALLTEVALQMPEYLWPLPQPKTPWQQLQYDFSIACGYTPNLALVTETLAAHPELATLGLYEAVHQNQMDMAHLLLQAGADVNGPMPFACWFTPLMHALRYPQPRWEMAELLLKNHIAINAVNGLGMSAPAYYCFTRHHRGGKLAAG